MEEEEENFESEIINQDASQINALQQIQKMHVSPLISGVIAIEYYREKFNKLRRKEGKLWKQVKQLRYVQKQFWLLIQQHLAHHYGKFKPIPKQLAPISTPLPKLHRENHKNLISLLKIASPSDIPTFFTQTAIVQSLLLNDRTVFDQDLQSCLERIAPDLQITFLTQLFSHVQMAGDFFNQFFPFISQVALNYQIQNIFSNPNADFSSYYKAYDSFLSSISKIFKCNSCRLLFSQNNGKSLVYPTSTYTFIINTRDSLSGSLFKSLKPNFLSNPKNSPLFDIAAENSVFPTNDCILSIPFGIRGPITPKPTLTFAEGLIILYRDADSSFSSLDEIYLSSLVSFLDQVFLLFKSLFLHVLPCHFTKLTEAIASLRNELSLFPLLISALKSLTGCTTIRIFSTEQTTYDDCIISLHNKMANSLIKISWDQKTSFSYKYPRLRKDFNKNIDDDPSLSKISSLLTIPLASCHLIFALYNTTLASEFTDIHISLASLFIQSLPPLLQQLEIRKYMAKLDQQQASKIQSYQIILDAFPKLTLLISSNPYAFCPELSKVISESISIVTAINSINDSPSKRDSNVSNNSTSLNDNQSNNKSEIQSNNKTEIQSNGKTEIQSNNKSEIQSNNKSEIQSNNKCDIQNNEENTKINEHCYGIFYFITETLCLRLPDHKMVIATEQLKTIEKETILSKDEFNLEVEAFGDQSIQSIYMIPKTNESRSVICYLSQDEDFFYSEDISCLNNVFSSISLLIPLYIKSYQQHEIALRNININEAILLNTPSLSTILNAKIYEKPKTIEIPIDDQQMDQINSVNNNNKNTQDDSEQEKLTISVDTEKGTATVINCVGEIDEAGRNSLINYAQYMSSEIGFKEKNLDLPDVDNMFLSFFLESGILEMFNCSIFTLSNWLKQIVKYGEKSEAEELKRLKFVQLLLQTKKWKAWYQIDEVLLVYLVSFVRSFISKWKCSVDDDLLDECQRLNKLENVNITSEAAPYISIIFGKEWGLADSLPSSKRSLLIVAVNDIAVNHSIKEELGVLNHVRTISLKNFKVPEMNMRSWVAKGIVLLSDISNIQNEPEKCAEQICKDEETIRNYLFKVERLYIPLLSFLGQRDEKLLEIVGNLKTFLKVLHTWKK